MPRLIEPGPGGAIGLDELVDRLDAAAIDPRDEDGFAALGPWLARLGRNPHFLTDLAIAELKARCANQATTNGYGAQVFLLRPTGGRYLLRANFWPARADAVVRASGTAPFFYGLPHDHNFPFLTYGYLGPGYWSDYYLFGGPAEEAVAGDPARLVFDGRRRLEPGQLMLYRAHRDVHVQLPPDAFSVTLNVIASHPGQRWRSQYRFDIARDAIDASLTTAPSEALAALAVGFGGGNGIDLAHHLARAHPNARMRRTALDALVGAADDTAARVALYEAAADDPVLARHARRRIERIRSGP